MFDTDFVTLFKDPMTQIVVRVLLMICLGFPALFLLYFVLDRLTRRRLSGQARMILSKGVFYGGALVLVFSILQELDFQIGPLLGAAGVIGVAVGFASQTSLSNIISGLFVISERPFGIGDLIEIGTTRGFVHSIDLLSIKLRTFDNRVIRIPNENVIKTEVTNITQMPVRRIDVQVGVAYKEDVRRVMEILKDVADKNPYCLDEPESIVIFTDFGDSSLNFLFGVWCVKSDFLNLKNSIMLDIKERFDAEDIEIPFPHRTVYAGSVTDPFPVRVVPAEAETEAEAEAAPADTD